MAGCRMGDGRQLWKSEIRKLCEVRGRRFRVALLPTEIPGSREPGLLLNLQLGRIPAKMRQGRSPSAGLVSLHQRETQRLLWQLVLSQQPVGISLVPRCQGLCGSQK
jgi:hypothetical protein